jgi:hypothetical protein
MYLYTTYTRALSVQAQYNRSCLIISSSCFNSSLVTWTVVCLTDSLSWNKAPIWGLYDQIFITVRQLRVCWFWALSLTRGRVCNLTFLLVLASAIILRVRVPWDSRQYFSLSDSRRTFSSPPTTRRFAVEVFYPASTLEYNFRWQWDCYKSVDRIRPVKTENSSMYVTVKCEVCRSAIALYCLSSLVLCIRCQ